MSAQAELLSPLGACISLVRGAADKTLVTDWNAVITRTRAERCLALAWLRSESFIRAHAPRAVTARWAEEVDRLQDTARLQAASMMEVTRWLAAHGVAAVVLKGIPLSQHLYGEAWVRPVSDLDLYIDRSDGTAAVESLQAIGWRHLRGEFPADIEMVKLGSPPLLLEMHCSLAGSWQGYRQMPPPEEQEIAVGSASVRFFSGALLPAYLASHMLHHWPRPLLWLNDFATLWTGLSTAQRQAGIEAAQQVRWSRVLRLAIRWTDLLSDAAAAASPSLRRVEDEILSPRARIAVRQLLSTSESVRDRGVMLRELVLPASARGNVARVLSLWRQRLTGGERPK